MEKKCVRSITRIKMCKQCQLMSKKKASKLQFSVNCGIIVKILKTSKSHFAIRSDPIKSKALYYHYLDLPILRTTADLEYYHSHSVDFFLIVLHLSDHMITGCRHPGCLTAEYTFVFIVIFSYLLCFTFSSVLKSVLPFVLVQF